MCLKLLIKNDSRQQGIHHGRFEVLKEAQRDAYNVANACLASELAILQKQLCSLDLEIAAICVAMHEQVQRDD